MRYSFIFLVFFPLLLWAETKPNLEVIKENIKPIGEVYVDESENVEKGEAGKEIYEKYCSVCHQDGIAGAPRFHESKDWDTRLSQKNKDELLASALKGINVMPAKGTCYECSDTDIKNAIEFMLPKP